MATSEKDKRTKAAVEIEDQSRPFFKSELFWWYIVPAFVLRFILWVFEWKVGLFTDIDYRIFTEAGQKVLEGESPFDRFTYRYSPLVAWIMIPANWFEPYGKGLFQLTDLVAIYYFGKIMQIIKERQKDQFQGRVYRGLGFWVSNAYMIEISGRGSLEALQLVLFTSLLYYLMKFNQRDQLETPAQPEKKGFEALESIFNFSQIVEKPQDRDLVKAGVIYGLFVHLRLYPILYGLSIVLFIQKGRLMPNSNTVKFFFVSAGVFTGLFALGYILYGYKFVHEWALYHLTRKDPRHSVSVFWLKQLYDMVDGDKVRFNLITLAFRLGIIFWVSLKFRRNIVMAMFITTMVFTIFNTVYTAQYTIWEIQFFPLIFKQADLWLKNFSFPKFKLAFLLASWAALLLYTTHQGGEYEHEGKNRLYRHHYLNIVYMFFRIGVVKFVLDNRIPYSDFT